MGLETLCLQMLKTNDLPTLFWDLLQNQWFEQHMFEHVAKTIGVTTRPNIMLLKPIVFSNIDL